MKRVVLLLIIFFLYFPINVSADTIYDIDNLDVKINVSNYNTYEVTQTFTVDYGQNNHNVELMIPLLNDYYDNDNNKIMTKSKFILKDCNVTCKKKRKDNNMYLYLSDNLPNKTTYVVSYKIDKGFDFINNYDFFSFDIIPKNFKVKKATFSINFPEKVNESDVQFNNSPNYNVNNSVITGSISDSSSLSLFIKLKEGYFSNQRMTINLLTFNSYVSKVSDFVIRLIPVLLVLVIFMCGMHIYNKYFLKEKEQNIKIKYSLPDNITPSEASFLMNRKLENKQIISLILYHISRNYIKIYKKDNKLYIKRSKPYKSNEKEYIKNSFKDVFANSNKVELSKINLNIDESLQKLKDNYSYLYDSDIKDYRKLLTINFIISIVSMFLIKNLIINLILLSIGILSLILANKIKKSDIKLNSNDKELLNDVLGFRMCLELLNKNSLLELLDKYPNYFYMIYQYVYIFNLKDKWDNMFTKEEKDNILINNVNLSDIFSFDKYF